MSEYAVGKQNFPFRTAFTFPIYPIHIGSLLFTLYFFILNTNTTNHTITSHFHSHHSTPFYAQILDRTSSLVLVVPQCGWSSLLLRISRYTICIKGFHKNYLRPFSQRKAYRYINIILIQLTFGLCNTEI